MNHSQTLAENRYNCKRSAASLAFRHSPGVIRSDRKPKKTPKTETQALFIERIWEELDNQEITPNGLAQRKNGPKQRTLNDVLNGSEPRLTAVHQIAAGLGVQPWELLKHKEGKQTRAKVEQFPSQSPLGLKDKYAQNKENGKRKRRSAG